MEENGKGVIKEGDMEEEIIGNRWKELDYDGYYLVITPSSVYRLVSCHSYHSTLLLPLAPVSHLLTPFLPPLFHFTLPYGRDAERTGVRRE